MRSTFIILAIAAFCSSVMVSAATVIPLGHCQNFTLMASVAINANGGQTTVYTGSIGVSPGTSITGNIVLDDGAIENDSTAASNCASDMLIAYADAKNATCTTVLANDDLGGVTFYPGTYCTAGSTIRINAGQVTLDGLGDVDAQFIFQTADSIITATQTSFILQNGAQAANVFWQAGSLVSIAGSSSFVGTILAYKQITFDTSATLNGRALSQTAVTFAGGDSVSLP